MLTLIPFTVSWSDEFLINTMETYLRIVGGNAQSLIKGFLNISKDNMERLSCAGAWISYVERPPFNIKSFNHWRYQQNPIGKTEIFHSNEDDLYYTLNKTYTGLSDGSINGPWTLNFAFKVFIGLEIEAFNPSHNVELFDGNFSEGDDSGKKYIVKYNGKDISLHDFWETGCGQYNLNYPFTEEQWKKIDANVTKIIQELKPTETLGLPNIDSIREKALANAEEYFYGNGVAPNKELPKKYVTQCQTLARQTIVIAANTLSTLTKKMTVPAGSIGQADPPFSANEMIPIGLFIVLLPTAIFIAWHLFIGDKRNIY